MLSPIPPMLLQARRAIDEYPSLALVRDVEWNYLVERWVFCVRAADPDPTEYVPATTDWWVHVEARYPWGSIAIYPAKKGGVTHTFPHQSRNGVGEPHLPWRSGDVCLRVPAAGLGRHAVNADPIGDPNRLRWYLARLVAWVHAAATGTLRAEGDFFELPSFDPSMDAVAFIETPNDLLFWRDLHEQAGIAEFAVVRASPLLLALKTFRTMSGDLVHEPRWGSRVNAAEQTSLGIWFRLSRPPIIEPYAAPATWGDLRQAMLASGQSLDELLKRGLPACRDGKRHFGVMGFPIPKHVGGADAQMHWQGFKLPLVSCGEDYERGFRKGPEAYWKRDQKRCFTAGAVVQWMSVENWADEEVGSRGLLRPVIRAGHWAVLGAGAMGAPVAELLVRGGVRKMLILDPDLLAAGNLVRHTLTTADVTHSKAKRVVDRLQRISLTTSADAFPAAFPGLTVAEMESVRCCNVIVDCTGSDDVLAGLSELEWQEPVWFFSLSVSVEARRVYVYSACDTRFPVRQFREVIAPWIEADQRENSETTFPQEGVGCWHPVFPATADAIAIASAVAVRCLSEAIEANKCAPQLTVYERQDNGEIRIVRMPQHAPHR